MHLANLRHRFKSLAAPHADYIPQAYPSRIGKVHENFVFRIMMLLELEDVVIGLY